MAVIKYKISLYSDWHTGSGLTSGSELDALVIKGENNLPFIPGRTLKGLLREAADEIFQFSEPDVFQEGFIDNVFGYWDDKNTAEDEYPLKGSAHFSNAELSIDLKNEIIRCSLQPFLYGAISSTAIEDGLAKAGSLRRSQITVPCDLYASVLNIEDKYKDDLILCFGWIKRIGMNRHRGLGRCDFCMVE